jgi:ech hydrogenase subunit D
MTEMTERKDLIQEIISVSASDLLETVSDIKADGQRLGQICATKIDDGIEVLYSFEKDSVLKNIKAVVTDKGPVMHSITAIYPPAFIYENEMHDLFGITFKNLALDYGGHFFKIAAKTPWNPQAQEADTDANTVEAALKEDTPQEAALTEEKGGDING